MSTLAFDPEETTQWEQIKPRKIAPEQWRKFEGYAAEIFEAFGMDLDTPGTLTTPKRYLRALFDATSGYEGDPKLLTAFPTECHGGPDCNISQVIEGPIEFFSLCEHHALPFHGHAYIGYIAHEEIIGISKLTRLLRLFARGVREGHAPTLPWFWRGNYEKDPQLRTEFLQALEKTAH